MHLRTLLLAALIPLTLAACGEPEDTLPGQPIKHRREAFEKILHAFEPMGVQLRENKYDADSFLKRAQQLETLKNGPWEYFKPDTNVPPTHAKAEVWSKPDQFKAGQEAFLKGVDGLLVAAETKDLTKISKAYETLHTACKDCHKTFKEE